MYYRPETHQTELARAVQALSREQWGGRRDIVVVGRDEALAGALEMAVRFAASDLPVLITGETGTGKELVARAVHLHDARHRKTFLSVDCARYHDGSLLASELFGHRKGSVPGATADRRGLFEEADGGTLFLDEVGDLSLPAQAMLLRALSEGEVVPVGGSQARSVDVRVLAATSRDLGEMVAAGTFRADLFYRLQLLHVHLPPLRDRGGDWELVSDFYLDRLAEHGAARKRLSPEASRILEGHPWPGNVREVRGLVDTGFHMSAGEVIEPAHFGHSLERVARDGQLRKLAAAQARGADLCARMLEGEGTFWEMVHQPFLDRELNRAQVREILARGLEASGGSYKRLMVKFGMHGGDYLRFMDFLRHHRLKPDRPRSPDG
jgi:transcriptional regulator with GAF, ATPase, and Fis domain